MRKPTQAAKVAQLAPEPVAPWGILAVGAVVRAPMTPYRLQDLIVVNDPGPPSDESRKVRTKSSVKDRDFAPIYMRRDRLCRGCPSLASVWADSLVLEQDAQRRRRLMVDQGVGGTRVVKLNAVRDALLDLELADQSHSGLHPTLSIPARLKSNKHPR